MPYCCQCGGVVAQSDVYCAKCGARQATARRSIDPLSGISPRLASLLCYVPVIGWIAAIIVLASARFRDDRNVRFHAFQGLYLFVAWLIVDWVLQPMFRFSPYPGFTGNLLKAVLFAASIFMIVKASQDQVYRLPIFGELAERSVEEQK